MSQDSETSKEMGEAVTSWLEANKVIAKFFVDLLGPRMNAPDKDFSDMTIAERNAAAIQARLASADRPMLIVYADELKE